MTRTGKRMGLPLLYVSILTTSASAPVSWVLILVAPLTVSTSMVASFRGRSASTGVTASAAAMLQRAVARRAVPCCRAVTRRGEARR